MTIKNRVVQVHQMRPQELEEHPDNWRKHPKRQIDALQGVLESIGFAGALLAYRTGDGKLRLIDGHARQKLVTDVVTVLETDLSEDEAATLLSLFDPISAMATADKSKLAGLLGKITSDDARVQALVDRLARDHDIVLRDPQVDTSEKVGEAEALQNKWQVQRGDVWRIPSASGRVEHRLICGDSTDPQDLLRLMGDERAVCMWTDPPYGVNYVGKTGDQMTIQNDSAEGLDALLQGAFAAADSVLLPGAAIYIAHPAGLQSLTFMQRFLAQGWRFHQALVWVKDSLVLGHQDYHYQHEPIIYGYAAGGGRRGRGGDGWHGSNAEASVLMFVRPKASQLHPTMKPPELVAHCVQNSAAAGEVVLDIFNGSGTTLIACEQTGRAGRGVELEPKFCAVTLERLSLIGLKPERVSNGAQD